ncbi:hypothetical protein NPIL_589521 [Nephila pilipes]|uniref:Uncharacterized protein n=1 Tax=Nephila pilipes TaxID=299642 RepID=A0A8X6NZX3_NEPPI|nr:hypothetical protein NPIL_589521 [Nephila pilipes]
MEFKLSALMNMGHALGDNSCCFETPESNHQSFRDTMEHPHYFSTDAVIQNWIQPTAKRRRQSLEIYDPVGFLSLYTIKLKMLITRTWLRKLVRDDLSYH